MWWTRPEDLSLDDLFIKIGEAGVKERIPFNAQEAYRRADEIISFAELDVGLPFITKYNALGAIYPWLSPDERQSCLAIFAKGLNDWGYARFEKEMLPYVREPLFFADMICVHDFSINLHEASNILQEAKTQNEFTSMLVPEGLFRPEYMQEFLLTYASLRPDLSPHASTALQHMNRNYIARVVTGVSNMCLHTVEEYPNEPVSMVKSFFPEELHGKIWKAYNKKEWATRKNS